MEEIPESDETKAAKAKLEQRLEFAFPAAPWAVMEAVDVLIQSRIADAIEYASNRVQKQIQQLTPLVENNHDH